MDRFRLMPKYHYENTTTNKLKNNQTKSLRDYIIVGEQKNKSGIPETYVELDYIESTGTEYIDIELKSTDIYNYSIEFETVNKFQESLDKTIDGIMGTIEDNLDTNICFDFSNETAVKNTVFFMGASFLEDNPIYDLKSYIKKRHQIYTLDNKIYIDEIACGNISYPEETGNNNVYLFALNQNNVAVYHSLTRLYSCKIYDKSGVLLRDFIPCYRISDNLIGLYDNVNNKFYINQNSSGIFNMGNKNIKGVGEDTVNLLPYPYYSNATLLGGITFAVNDDGTVLANGTATADVSFYLRQSTENFVLPDNGKFVLSGCPKGGSFDTYFISFEMFKDSSREGWFREIGDGVVIDASTLNYTGVHVCIRIQKGTVINNLVFKPQIQKGTEMTEYEPYKKSKIILNINNKNDDFHDFNQNLIINNELRRGESIYFSKNVRYNKNLIPYPYTDINIKANGITYKDNGDGTITANGTATAISEYKFLSEHKVSYPAGDYIFSGCPNGGGYSTYRIEYAATYSGVGWDIIDSRDFGTGLKFTAPKGIKKLYGKITIQKGVTVNNLVFKPQLEFGNEVTEYTTYNSQKIDLKTVYLPAIEQDLNAFFKNEVNPKLAILQYYTE